MIARSAILESEKNEIGKAHSKASRREVKPDRGRVIQLDFVRGLAILLVMEYHFLTVPTTNLVAKTIELFGKRTGWMGVDLFFVLSGFLVGGLLVQELEKTRHIRIGRFLVRRMLKIWPAYYFYIFFQICVRIHPLGTFMWQNLLNVQNYTGTSLDHTWSLAVEEHFYLMLPFVLLFIFRVKRLRRWTPHILLGICFLVLCGRVTTLAVAGTEHIQWETHTRLDSLLYGVMLSYALYMTRERFEALLKYRELWFCLSVLVFVIALFFDYRSVYMTSIGYTVNYVCFGGLLLLVYGFHGRLTGTSGYRTIAWIGRYSYGIYLWHLSVRMPLYRLSAHLPPGIRWFGLFVSQYAAAIALGFLVTKGIEFPVLRLRDRLFPRGVAIQPPTVP